MRGKDRGLRESACDAAATPKEVLVLAEASSGGGTTVYLRRLMGLLLRENMRVSLYWSGDVTYESIVPDGGRSGEVNVLWTAFRPRWFRFFIHFPLSLLDDLQVMFDVRRWRRADLLLVSVGTPWRWLLSSLIARRAVYILHTVPDGVPGGRFTGRLGWSLLGRLVERRSLRFVSVSDYSCERMASLFPPVRGRVHRVYNYADEPRSPQIGRARDLVVTAAHVEPYKNPFFWLEVAKRLTGSGIRCVWAGEGSQRAAVMGMAADDTRVELPGHVSDMESLFSRSRVYFQPSLKESQSIAVAEAMMRGIPCVVSSREGLPESLEDGVTGFVFREFDADHVAGLIQRLFDDEALWQCMSQASRERARSLFSVEQWESSMREILWTEGVA